MADSLKIFQEAETILASDTNNNNRYLLDKISEIYSKLKTWLDGEVGRIFSNIQSGDATLQVELDKLKQTVEKNNNSLYKNLTPDYTKGINVGLPLQGNPFTAPKNGMYFINIGQNNATRYLYINGVQAFTYTEGAERTSYQTFFIPLLKGDQIFWNAGAGYSQSTFYPYRGEA